LDLAKYKTLSKRNSSNILTDRRLEAITIVASFPNIGKDVVSSFQGRAVNIPKNTLAAKGGDPINYQSKRGAFEPAGL